MTSHPPAAASSQLDERHIPADVVGLKLLRIAEDGSIACDAENLAEGYDAVLESLRRANARGRAEVGGRIGDHFADLVNAAGMIVATVALDGQSYRVLLRTWTERLPPGRRFEKNEDAERKSAGRRRHEDCVA